MWVGMCLPGGIALGTAASLATPEMAHAMSGPLTGSRAASVQCPSPRVDCSEDAMGGLEKKRGDENLTKDTLPKQWFWTPLRLVHFPPSSDIIALFFLHKNPQLRRPEALLEGPKANDLFSADLIVGMEEIDMHYRCRGRLDCPNM